MLDQVPPPTHADIRYEASDARPRALLGLGALLAAAILSAHAGSAWLFDSLKMRTQPHPALLDSQRTQLPQDLPRIPPPRLQVAEPLDLETVRQAEDALLTGYAWVNREQGIVRIPIAEAMRLLAKKQSATKYPEGKP